MVIGRHAGVTGSAAQFRGPPSARPVTGRRCRSQPARRQAMFETLDKFSTRVAFNEAIGVCLQDLQEFGTSDLHTAELMVIGGYTVNGWTGELVPIPSDVRERHKEHIAELNLRRRLQGLPPR